MDQGNQGSKHRHRYMKTKIENNGIYLYNKKEDKYFYLCNYIDVKTVKTNIITGDIEVEMEYYHNNKKKTMTVYRDVFVKSKILNVLPAKGIDVTDSNVSAVLEYLLFREQYAKHINVHDQIGWAEIEGQRVFLHHKVIGSNQESHYSGNLGIEPKGTLDSCTSIIKEDVLGREQLELAFVLGLSSPLASLLRQLLGIDVLFFHICGESTTGKTTALTLATSTFGCPSKNNRGLIKTWLATNNAIIGYFRDVHGIPMALDEASVKANQDYTNMIYQLTDGIEKARMNRDGKNRDRAEWSGTILSTAENSILDKSSQNTGVRVRLLELKDEEWTESAKQAEKLKALLLENYGHIGVRFVEYLMDYSDEELLEAFKRSKMKVLEKIEVKDNFSDRISDKIAVIYLTALFAKDVLEIELDAEKILQILIDADSKQVEDRDIAVKAYEYFKSEVTRNMHKFVYKDNLSSFDADQASCKEKILPNGEIIGRLEMNSKDITQVLIARQQLDKILKDGGFTDTNLILSKWRAKGLLDHDSGKFTRKRRLFSKGISVRVVVINMKNSIEDEQKKQEKAETKEQRKVVANKKIIQQQDKASKGSNQISQLFKQEEDENINLGGDTRDEIKSEEGKNQ